MRKAWFRRLRRDAGVPGSGSRPCRDLGESHPCHDSCSASIESFDSVSKSILKLLILLDVEMVVLMSIFKFFIFLVVLRVRGPAPGGRKQIVHAARVVASL